VAPSWIITLHAGASPALIPEPPASLSRYDFFTSRSLEDGRERFRLHLGYFDDLPSAKKALGVVREYYPAAWLVPADHYRALRPVSKEAAIEPSTRWQAPEPTSASLVAEQQEAEAVLGAAEVLALLDGAAVMLAGVLPAVALDEPMLAGDATAAESEPEPGRGPTDVLVREMSRFIVEEWKPEARRPLRPLGERPWYTRFRRSKRPSRSQTRAT